MFDRFMEYKEAKEFRKDRLQRQRTRQLFIFMAILGVLLAVICAIQAIAPPHKAVSASSVPTANQREIQEIKEFADIVTKPVGELTKEDLDLVDSKAGDPCYEKNAMLPKEQMIKVITACKLK